MDDIRLVDCFEKLHQHLLRHEPELQKRVHALPPPHAYRTQDLTYFLIHLVALLSGLDERTAEGKRRIRRFLMTIDEERPAETAAEHLAVREKGGVFEKPLGETQRRNLRESFQNLKDLTDGPDGRVGEVFHARLEELECLPARITWLRKTLPCLTNLNAFGFLNRIGYPVLVPNSRCQTFLYRLGLLDKTGGSLGVQLDACRAGDSIAAVLKRSVGEIHFWIAAFTGALSDLSAKTALCLSRPQCPHCDLQSYCHYYRFQRPRARDASVPLGIKDWRPTERPRERLVQHGAHALEDTELLAIVLRTGAGEVNVLELARRLLERFGNLQGIEEASLEELRTIHGIGRMKAIEMKAVFELGRRQTFIPLQPGDTLDCSDTVFEIYRGRYNRVKQEEFVLLMLDNKNRVIREEVVSRGGLSESIVHPREVFKAAIRASAASVMFIHNHPSGDPTPSHDDFVITQKLEEAAELLQIRVLDHLVIGSDSYYSFTDGEVVTPADSRASGSRGEP